MNEGIAEIGKGSLARLSHDHRSLEVTLGFVTQPVTPEGQGDAHSALRLVSLTRSWSGVSPTTRLMRGAYPPAPLPAHERTWRHPSELGRSAWFHTEPPLTIGGGLLLTTSTIGGLLSLAVLWAMLPSAGRARIAGPTVVTNTSNDALVFTVTTLTETLVMTSVDVLVPSTALRTGPSSVPVSDRSVPPTTAAPDREEVPTAATEGSAQFLESDPVAVRIGDSLVVTTARAVKGRSVITLTNLRVMDELPTAVTTSNLRPTEAGAGGDRTVSAGLLGANANQT